MSAEDEQSRRERLARAVATKRRRYSMLGFGSMTRLVGAPGSSVEAGVDVDVYSRYSLIAAYQGMALVPILFKKQFADRCNHLL